MTRFVSVGTARRLKFGRNWGFAAFMMVVAFLFLPQTECGTSMWDRQTTATVTRVEETSSAENENTIYRIHYTFRDERGDLHEGTSYSTTRHAGEQPVLYVAREPDDSRLVDARTQPFGTFGLVVALFVFGAGIVTALKAYGDGTRWLHLVRHGTEARGIETARVHLPGDADTAEKWTITYAYERDGVSRDYELTTADAAFPSEVRILYEGALVTTIEEIPVDLTKEPGYSAHLLVLPFATLGLAIATIVATMVH